jgi:hypothetical protein
MKTRPVVVSLFVTSILLTAASLQAQAVTSTNGRIDVHAEGVPVGRLLRELLPMLPMESMMIDPKVEGKPVTVSISGASTGEALNTVLESSGLPYGIWGGAQGPWRLVLGDKDSAVQVTVGTGIDPSIGLAEADRQAGTGPLAAQWAAHEQEAAEQSASEREAEARPIVNTTDPEVPGGYTMVGESVTFHDPTFVPYKNRPEVRARREAIDVTTIP